MEFLSTEEKLFSLGPIYLLPQFICLFVPSFVQKSAWSTYYVPGAGVLQ